MWQCFKICVLKLLDSNSFISPFYIGITAHCCTDKVNKFSASYNTEWELTVRGEVTVKGFEQQGELFVSSSPLSYFHTGGQVEQDRNW